MSYRLTRFVILVVVATVLSLSTHAALPSKTTAATNEKIKTPPAELPKSNFEVPVKPEQGRDPFFPASTRPFGVTAVQKKPTSSNSTPLVFNGLSGTGEQRLAIINGHTFAEGEEAPVNTSSGRVQVRCVEIKDGVVVIEVGGDRRELRLRDH